MADEEHEGTEPMRVTPWTLDKTINVPMMFTVFTAIVTVSIWAGNMNQRMSNVEASVKRIDDTVSRISDQQADIKVIDERSTQNRKDLDRLIAEIARRNGIDL